MEVPVEIAHAYVVKVMLESTVKNQFAKNSVKMGADVLGPIGVLVFMDTLEGTVRLTTGLALVSEELIMICVLVSWKVWFVPNSFVVLLLVKLGDTLVKSVLINCPARRGS